MQGREQLLSQAISMWVTLMESSFSAVLPATIGDFDCKGSRREALGKKHYTPSCSCTEIISACQTKGYGIPSNNSRPPCWLSSHGSRCLSRRARSMQPFTRLTAQQLGREEGKGKMVRCQSKLKAKLEKAKGGNGEEMKTVCHPNIECKPARGSALGKGRMPASSKEQKWVRDVSRQRMGGNLGKTLAVALSKYSRQSYASPSRGAQ